MPSRNPKPEPPAVHRPRHAPGRQGQARPRRHGPTSASARPRRRPSPWSSTARPRSSSYCFTSVEESRGFTPRLPSVWLNVHGLHDTEVLTRDRRRFRHSIPLVIEDILNTNQRPKVI